jgi:hypothetical protein
MAERSKAPVLKTGVGKPTGGSNPSPSAENIARRWQIFDLGKIQRPGFLIVDYQVNGEVPEWSNGAAC